MKRLVSIAGCLFCLLVAATSPACAETPSRLQTVLDNTKPLAAPRRGLPMFVLPISGSLKSVSDVETTQLLKALDERGIGYSVNWQPSDFDASLAEGLRIGRIQQSLGLMVSIDATACLMSFCDRSTETLHVDTDGNRFSDKSCGTELGCPFALEQRIPVIRRQVADFVKAYRNAGVEIDFIFADWEVDGPIEWNDSWQASKRCERCRKEVGSIDDFRQYQSALRKIRSRLQYEAYASVVTEAFPQALVGNYAVYPHDGYRYWYDYFEHQADDAMPFKADQKARYREWYPEFPETGYTFAMPVVYTWYPTFNWYEYESSDYRWFYNMLLTGTNPARHTSAPVPLISFVHWNTTAPPPNPDPAVKQMSESAYQELLWHLLLRGHDTFFLWCMQEELAKEVRLVHEVYSAAQPYNRFLERGEPISFDVPKSPSTVVSGLKLGNQVLVRRSEFGAPNKGTVSVQLAQNTNENVDVPAVEGTQILPVRTTSSDMIVLKRGQESLFPIGWYESPTKDDELRELAESGVNLMRCGNREALDRASKAGMLGWMPLAVQQGATQALREQISSVVDHPALAVWEGPDEIIWTFTAYSTLEKAAGIKKEDWYEQRPNATKYAEEQAAIILPKMREGVELIRSLDPQKRPFWMNEAADSDLRYVRGYTPFSEAIGCDYYPVRGVGEFDLRSIGQITDRWNVVGHNKPVWMVLQAFSWHVMNPDRGRRYPHFQESRYMAYNAITHGAKGIFYWGSNQIDDPAFRKSLYATTAELAAVQPFLTQKTNPSIHATVARDLFEPTGNGVRADARRSGDDLLIFLVNEDNHRHLGVDVSGLATWEGRTLFELYGSDEVDVQDGSIAIRIKPLEVKVYSTNRRFETSRREGRDYVSPAPAK